MTPESSVFLTAADRALSNAHRVLAIDIPDQAGGSPITRSSMLLKH